MAKTFSLFLFPTEAGENAAPEVYFDNGGVLRSTGVMSLSMQKLPELRQAAAKVLSDLCALIEANPAMADAAALHGDGAAFFEQLPDEVRRQLRLALDAGPDPPVLRIFAEQRYDWIPWELFYDDERQHFLGMRYAIARIPIVTNPPEIPAGARKVSRIQNSLGPGVADDAGLMDGLRFPKWQSTFTGLTNGVVVSARPDGAVVKWPGVISLNEAMKSDILHLTCHGMRNQNNEFLLNLSPDHPIPTLAALGLKQIKGFFRSTSSPLIFTNACNPQGGKLNADKLEASGLGQALFEKGALNIVTTLAPVSRDMALAFARKFYENLLTPPHMPIGQAILKTRADLTAPGDPSYLFYSLYGPPETEFHV